MADLTLEQIRNKLRLHGSVEQGLPNWKLCDELADAIDNHITPRQEGKDVASVAPAWVHLPTIPEVRFGDHEYAQVAVRRARNGETYSFPAVFCNSFQVMSSDGEPTDSDWTFARQRVVKEGEADDGDVALTGWFTLSSNSEYDNLYVPVCNKGDKVIAWHALPQYDGTLKPAIAGLTGMRGYHAMRYVVECLKETANYTDEEGEDTDAIEAFLDDIAESIKG